MLAERLERVDWGTLDVALAHLGGERGTTVHRRADDLEGVSIPADRWGWSARLCESEPDFRIVVCTGASTVAQRVRALRIGVDRLAEQAVPSRGAHRARGVRRRSPSQAPAGNLEAVTLGEVEVRPDQYQAFVRGESIKLTCREFQLIELLCSAGGEILERELIYERLWG